MATVVMYRGYLGYQQRIPCARNEAYPRDLGTLEAYVFNGVMMLPILPWTPSVDDLGNKGSLAHYYSGTCDFQYEYVLIDDEDFTYMEFDSRGSRNKPKIIKSPIATTHTLQCVLSDDIGLAEFLHGLISANATLEQINQFVAEYACGTMAPFIWAPLGDVIGMVDASKNSKERLTDRTIIPEPVRVDKPTFGNIIPIVKPERKKTSCRTNPPVSPKTKRPPSPKRSPASKSPKPSTPKSTQSTTKRRVSKSAR